MAALRLSVVALLKPVRWISATSPRRSYLTVVGMMRPRFMLITYSPPCEARSTVIATGAPTEPRSLPTTSLSGRSIIDSPSIDRIWSPTWMPALAAGEPSWTARIMIFFSSVRSTVIPTPPPPSRWKRLSRASSGSA